MQRCEYRTQRNHCAPNKERKLSHNTNVKFNYTIAQTLAYIAIKIRLLTLSRHLTVV